MQLQQYLNLSSLTQRFVSLVSKMRRIESFSWTIGKNGPYAEVIETIFPIANIILPTVPNGTESTLLSVRLDTRLRASSCNKKDKNSRSVRFSTLFNIVVSKHLGSRYGPYPDRMCPDIIRPDEDGGTTIAAWGDRAVLKLSCRASSLYEYPNALFVDWGDGTFDTGLTCRHGQDCSAASFCRGNPKAVPSYTLSRKYDLDGLSSRDFGVTIVLCADPGDPSERCCDSIYQVVPVENYDECSTAAGADQENFDMSAFMDVENNNINSCVSTNSTMMTFSNSCFESAPAVMLGDCNTGIKECGEFTPISDVLDNCAIYLPYGDDGADEYSKCVERFTDPFVNESPWFCFNCDRRTAPFLTQQQRDALLCCADAHAHDNAKAMKKCSSAGNADEISSPKEKKKKGKKSRIRTRALRKMRGRMSKL